MKIGDKIIAIDPCVMYDTDEPSLTIGKEYKVIEIVGNEFYIKDDTPQEHRFTFHDFDEFFELPIEKVINWLTKKEATTPSHYDNTNGSLYLFAEQHKLNAWEFEVIKRIVRCRKKGEFLTDIEKTIKVLELYRDEQGDNYKGQTEPLNK